VVDSRAHLSIRELGLRSPSNSLLQVAQPFNASADFVKALCAFGDQSCDRLVVAGNHDLLALRDTLEQLSEPGLRLECGDRSHRSSKIDQSLTSLAWRGLCVGLVAREEVELLAAHRRKPKTRASVVSEMEAAIAISYPLVEKSPTPLLIGWIEHQAEHYGKLVSNHRSVGIVPPISRKPASQ
jgi:hypothetical protein